MKEYGWKLFQLIPQFKSVINRYIIQEDWLLLKTRNHVEKLEKKVKHKKLKKLQKLCKDNSNLYFACLRHFDAVMMNFLILNIFLSFLIPFVPDFENLYYLVEWHNINGTLRESNSDKEIVLDITGFHYKEVLNK